MFIHIVAYHCFKLLYNIQICNFILLSHLHFDMLPPKSWLRTCKSPLVTSIFQCEAHLGIRSLNKTLPDSLYSYMGITDWLTPHKNSGGKKAFHCVSLSLKTTKTAIKKKKARRQFLSNSVISILDCLLLTEKKKKKNSYLTVSTTWNVVSGLKSWIIFLMQCTHMKA